MTRMKTYSESMATRRRFLERTGLAAAACWYPSLLSAAESKAASALGRSSARSDVLIVGGGLGGCAAALAATCMGARGVMTEPTDWIS
ncbi:MAG: NADPH-dependent 2,4-dienoyl-CoA reductase/sulfur reductase-like enzyme, partial [Rhodothermales bacterium]